VPALRDVADLPGCEPALRVVAAGGEHAVEQAAGAGQRRQHGEHRDRVPRGRGGECGGEPRPAARLAQPGEQRGDGGARGEAAAVRSEQRSPFELDEQRGDGGTRVGTQRTGRGGCARHPERPERGLGGRGAGLGEVGLVQRGVPRAVEHQPSDGLRRGARPRGECRGPVADADRGQAFHPDRRAQQLDVRGRRRRPVEAQPAVENEVALLHHRARPFQQQGELGLARGPAVGVDERGPGLVGGAVEDVEPGATAVEPDQRVVLQQRGIDLSAEYRGVAGGRFAGAVPEHEKRGSVGRRARLADADHAQRHGAESGLLGVGGHGQLTAVDLQVPVGRHGLDERDERVLGALVERDARALRLGFRERRRQRRAGGCGRCRRHVLAAHGHRGTLGRTHRAAREQRAQAEQGGRDPMTRWSCHVPSRSCWLPGKPDAPAVWGP
jgi:hypothetical protein